MINGNEIHIHKTTIRVGCVRWRAASVRGQLRSSLRDTRRFHFGYTTSANGPANRPVLLEKPVKDVIVIAADRRATHDQFPLAPTLGLFRKVSPGHVAPF